MADLSSKTDVMPFVLFAHSLFFQGFHSSYLLICSLLVCLFEYCISHSKLNLVFKGFLCLNVWSYKLSKIKWFCEESRLCSLVWRKLKATIARRADGMSLLMSELDDSVPGIFSVAYSFNFPPLSHVQCTLQIFFLWNDRTAHTLSCHHPSVFPQRCEYCSLIIPNLPIAPVPEESFCGGKTTVQQFSVRVKVMEQGLSGSLNKVWMILILGHV